MVELKLTIEDDSQRVVQAAAKAAADNHRKRAYAIMQDARASIKTRPKAAKGEKDEAAPAGQPPYTRRGRIRAAIRYAADADGAVIGAAASIAGTSGEPHEIGGTYKGDTFEQRPFMGPALERNIHQIAGDWAGSIGT